MPPVVAQLAFPHTVDRIEGFKQGSRGNRDCPPDAIASGLEGIDHHVSVRPFTGSR